MEEKVVCMAWGRISTSINARCSLVKHIASISAPVTSTHWVDLKCVGGLGRAGAQMRVVGPACRRDGYPLQVLGLITGLWAFRFYPSRKCGHMGLSGYLQL